MLDLHCHILPEIDDGCESLEESFDLARFCVRDGITHVVATPHFNPRFLIGRPLVLSLVEEINEQFRRSNVPLTILPGNEVQVQDSESYRRDFEAGDFCHLGDRSAFTLLEFRWTEEHYPPDAAELIAWIRAQGTIPIVAHPERHRYFGSDPSRLRALADAGAWFQLTVDSLLGNFSVDAFVQAETVLREYRNLVLSTDAHNLRRCSGMSAGYTWISEHLGRDVADGLRANSDEVLAAITGD